jgi:hypothetical protein
MYADDTTIFSVGQTADEAIGKLNAALKDLYRWCLINKLTHHPVKSEVMLLGRGTSIGPVPPVYIGNSSLKWVYKTRLLGMLIDDKISWTEHMLELKKNFANKLNILKNSRFLPTNVLLSLYLKVIMPSITYGLVVCGGCCNLDNFNSFERLH